MAKVPINSVMLAWAMNQSDATPRQLASVTSRPIHAVEAWLEGTDNPHVGDLSSLARFLGRSPQFFRLPKPPDTAKSPVNRRAALVDAVDATPRESLAVRQTARLQTISRWSADKLGAEPLRLPAVQGRTAAAYAQTVRAWLGWQVREQVRATSKARVFRDLRRAIEAKGILVFLQKIGDDNSRGFSIPDSHVPAIFINASFRLGSVRSYTLLHELAHLARGDAVLHHEQDNAAERWCEAFAAAFLIPADDLAEYLSKGVVSKTKPDDLRRVRLVSNRYGASWQSVGYRLVELKHAPDHLPAIIAQGSEPSESGFGSPDGGGRTAAEIRLDEYGSEFSRLIVSALQEQSLSALDVRKFLRVDAEQLQELVTHLGISA
ncbi:ImmA/IrrE family metallo-endopeptidase [Nocardioides dongxiaopingii]|uniref:ImmA/IrrE family metallo-endopeptidase n=1 Tax=Nocardioides sp. S-1144 TaxID=2582905 RepID=UPI00110E7BDE|nr:ImmA/IrrE family metallo-endopeptidase [Nocardioides sp. S-1144]QCW51451.1 ImmA/IrrE family metallo-endopeptidase [Nocardioides sp. S-1144]